jgi:translation initiation factor IF-1
MHDQSKKDNSIIGTVTEALPNAFFRVKKSVSGGSSSGEMEEILCYLSGKMRLHRIRVLIGDKVVVEIDPYGGKGRIVKRL